MPAKIFDEDQQVRPASVLISLPVEEVWAFVRDISSWSKWVRESQLTQSNIEVVNEEIDGYLVFRVKGKDNQIGAMTFERAPGGRGTFVSMRMSNDTEHGKVGGVLSWYVGGDPKSASYINLRRLKAFMETGEVPTVEGQPNGREQELKH